ncbi:Uncharacterised protein [Candidatus Bilamarchaeum dharawalense]|uniref:Metallo-beta-lactamase domain-containing protein n=1 Tax=Candidatus Bilamarchaeum dharawalense TaxID=2885759 RepID=A0A5E4LW64_9ARCH|nr:Uncharacterised protein [Candidatus Bilamarchaeum dharawalense]
MKKILFGLVLFILLFGCFEGTPPEQNQTPIEDNGSTNNNGQVNIIVGGQTNQTIGKNVTENQTEDNTTMIKELEYTYNPNLPFGVYFIDVGGSGGHGNAILIKKGDLDVLVDAGPAETASKVIDFLRAKEVDDIEVMISTNADPKQYGGMAAVANSFKVEQFWWSDDSFGDSAYIAIVDKMVQTTKDVKRIDAGMSVDLNGMNFTFINPPTQRFNDINNDAVVTKITDRNFSLLLTSGIQTGAQGKLINQPELLKATIMQAPYYGVGAGTSNIAIFLLKVEPEVVVITGSSDESAIQGGSREPFKRLMTQYGIAWNETYFNGTVRIVSDGEGYALDALGMGQ